MRIRRMMAQRVMKIREGRLESARLVKDNAILEIEEAKSFQTATPVEASEVQDASESSGEEDSRGINWEDSRKVLECSKGKVGSKGKKRN